MMGVALVDDGGARLMEDLRTRVDLRPARSTHG
jgi:hypothetical protein